MNSVIVFKENYLSIVVSKLSCIGIVVQVMLEESDKKHECLFHESILLKDNIDFQSDVQKIITKAREFTTQQLLKDQKIDGLLNNLRSAYRELNDGTK